MPGARPEGRGRKPREQGQGAVGTTAPAVSARPEAARLLEAILDRENMMAAYRRVVGNAGAAGVDAMSVGELGAFLREHWPRIKEDLLAGRYRPQPVRRVEIPKPGGGSRTLGIPTVLDRLIQQALHQGLSPLFDPGFSAASYGFRPGRSAHQAVLAARAHVAAGRRWVVDIDLERFFDRVNHDVLMARVARTVEDKRVLRLIRRYLQAGLMADGVATVRTEGTPQGGPLSPLLSNILLDDLDKELERRGHAFCRYADDCNVYVQSRRAGERVMASLTRFLAERLRLAVNRREERGGPPLEAHLPGLHHDRPPAPAAARRTRERGAVQGQAPGAVAPGPGPQPRAHDPRPRPDPHRLDRLLPAGRGQGRLRGAGRMDQAAPALACSGASGSGRGRERHG